MKKVIAIMMVLAIVAGFAFATTDSQSHSLVVKTIVDEKLPAFQLRFTGSTITEATEQGVTTYTVNADSVTAYTNDGTGHAKGETFVKTANVYTDETNDPLYVGFDLGVEGTYPVHFYAYLVQNGEGYYAKTYKAFTLQFSDGRFDGLKVRGTDIDDVTKGDPTISVAPGTLTTGGTIEASNDTATIYFNGISCPAQPVMVADATYTWTGIPELDMGAYTADIVLKITTTY